MQFSLTYSVNIHLAAFARNIVVLLNIFYPFFLIFNPLVSSRNWTYKAFVYTIATLVQTIILSLDYYTSLATRLPDSLISVHTIPSLLSSQSGVEEYTKDNVTAPLQTYTGFQLYLQQNLSSLPGFADPCVI